MQNEREKVQHTTAFLERQAKKSVKELENKEKTLMDFYKLKQSRFEEMRMVKYALFRKKKIEGDCRTNCKNTEEQIHLLERTPCIEELQ